MKEFWSGRIRSLTPYTPGEQPKDRRFIKLNTNENPYPPSPRALAAIQVAAGDGLRLYPDPDCTQLRQTLADQLGVSADNVFVGNGSDEVLAMTFQAFFDAGSTIVFPDITYSFYPVYANLFGIGFRTVPLREDFTIPVESFLGGSDGVVIANPNAPTGIELPQEAIRRICRENPNVVVVVDEAYVDFGGTSAVALTREFKNLVVVQTFSKSRSLAGLRIGVAVADADLIAGLNCVKNSLNSYTLDRLALAGAQAAAEDTEYFQACCRKVMATRDRVRARLMELGFQVCPSKTNFLFASHPQHPAGELMTRLREQGILVRHFQQPRIENYLRISIGTDEEMDKFCAVMQALVSKEN